MPAAATVLLLLAAAAALLGLGFALGRVHARRRPPGPRGEGAEGDPFEASLGFNYLLANEVDRAIEVFSHAASGQRPAPVDLLIVLGNLHRGKGQVEKAIEVHRSLLERPGL